MAILLNLRFDATGDWNRLRGSIHSFVRESIWRFLFDAPGRNPELPCRPDGIDSLLAPPGLLVAKAMVVPVMGSAQRYGEFIADLESHGAWLGEPQMVRISRASSADQTRL